MHAYFLDWHFDGTLTRVHHALHAQARVLAGKSPTPSTAIVDSQTVKSAEKGGETSIEPNRYRGGRSR